MINTLKSLEITLTRDIFDDSKINVRHTQDIREATLIDLNSLLPNFYHFLYKVPEEGSLFTLRVVAKGAGCTLSRF